VQEQPDAELRKLLDSLLSHIRDVLQEKLVGLYLYGSLTTGDFDPGSSDVDLLAAISSDVSNTEFEALRAMHQGFARENPEWDDRVDVAYLSVTALQTFRSQTSPMAVISPGEPFQMKQAGRDWLVNWYLVRESGVALFGPPAITIITPITQQESAQSVREYAGWWDAKIHEVGERKEQAYAILTMCRALYVRRNGGEWVSKRQAALWAQAELPEWSSLIESALAWREAWREQQINHTETRADTIRFVHFVRDQILS
jgi:hypothetical protein